MLAYTHKNGNIALPIQEYDKLQQENLKSIKYEGMGMTEFNKLSSFDPDIRFKNVARRNPDGSVDVVISASVVDEIPTGFLPKRAYKALHFKRKEKLNPLSTSAYADFNVITVSSADIISQFKESLPVEEVSNVLVESIKKGKVNYFG
ncbi:hypothetical protein CI088_15850 [Enterococcus plantarum]|uniref:Uncharacterized protein n=1 Tax=Enterococcus plantarum TaxID=1077675 RepID=A0A2W3YRC1_9ENTE|nr:hypothetical protein [Enterococcus plantarum]PZL70121.1 hypothetical protein CI088_15850 [Enterococcus plantarum]